MTMIDGTPDDGNAGNLYTAPAAPAGKPRRSKQELAERRALRNAAKLRKARDKAAGQLAAQRLAERNAGNADVVKRRAAQAKAKGSRRGVQVRAELARLREDYAVAVADFGSRNEGTPQTHAYAARVKQSPLSRMVRLGKATPDQLASAIEIAEVVEMIEAGVSMRCATLERVDNMGAGRDALVEGLKRVRLEVAYTLWREAIPTPRRMIIDMVIGSRSYVSIAKAHGIHWRTARKRLLRSLDIWPQFVAEAKLQVSRDDLNAAHAALGEGDDL